MLQRGEINPVSCPATHGQFGSYNFAECERVEGEGHRGQHFGWVIKGERYCVWSKSGAMTTSGMPEYHCENCGLPTENVRERYRKGVFPEYILQLKWCFSCMFWKERQEKQLANDRYFVADWVAFYIPEKVYPGSPASFGPFIHKETGFVIPRQQLWCQGEIPETYRDWFSNDYTAIPGSFNSEYKGV